MITIYDIAKKSGYSPTAVSKALNDYPDISDKAKKIIKQTAKDMGYTVNHAAKSLKTKKSQLVGIIIDSNLEIGTHYNKIINNFRVEMEKLEYDTMFVSNKLSKRTYLEHCKYRGLDGVFVLSTNDDDSNSELLELYESNIPVVAIDIIKNNISSVNSENLQGIEIAVQNLFENGHKEIVFFGGPQNTLAGRERLEGFKNKANSLNLKCKENIEEFILLGNKFDFDTGYELFNKLNEKLSSYENKVTAIIAASDMIAFGAMSAMSELGFEVPKDFSIIGFDDIPFARYNTPKLTTVKQDYDLIGSEVANQLIDLIEKKAENTNIRVKTELVERNTVKNLIL